MGPTRSGQPNLQRARRRRARVSWSTPVRAGESWSAAAAQLRRNPEDEDAETSISPVREFVLRALNLLVAWVGLVALAPVFAIVAVAIKLDSPGPAFYRQLRVGLDRRDPGFEPTGGRRTADLGGRPFPIYKFRTMRVDAEEESGPVWARPDDDRITRVGRFLRRYRLDELPQLWNVVKGEMSVVGPRPERPAHVLQLRDVIRHYSLRQKVRPGITGWAQVNQPYDRSVDDVRRKVDLDLEYIRERTLTRELKIMLQTPLVMLGDPFREGAGRNETVEGRKAGDLA